MSQHAQIGVFLGCLEKSPLSDPLASTGQAYAEALFDGLKPNVDKHGQTHSKRNLRGLSAQHHQLLDALQIGLDRHLSIVRGECFKHSHCQVGMDC